MHYLFYYILERIKKLVFKSYNMYDQKNLLIIYICIFIKYILGFAFDSNKMKIFLF